MSKKTIIITVVVLAIVVVGYMWWKSMSTPPQNTPAMVETPTEAPATTALYMTKSDPTNGTFLTDTKGMSLYTYTKDTAGVSNCSGQCLANWPAFSAASVPETLPENLSTITRDDGTIQYTWKGMPLYYYVKDAAPGDTTGEGVGGVWYLAK